MKTQFHPQHKNKCYCQNGKFCFCKCKTFSENSKLKYTFIKVRKDDDGKKTILSSENNSNTMSSVPTLMSYISNSFAPSAQATEPRLTERRALYEQSQRILQSRYSEVKDKPWGEVERNVSGDLVYGDIAALQEFRLQNADDCLSTWSRISMNKLYKTGILSETMQLSSEKKYALSKRGLVESVNNQSLHKTSLNRTSMATMPDSKTAAKDILQQTLRTSKEKNKFLQKALCVPENSLALRYQKTY